jgi:hypothetical protein
MERKRLRQIHEAVGEKQAVSRKGRYSPHAGRDRQEVFEIDVHRLVQTGDS